MRNRPFCGLVLFFCCGIYLVHEAPGLDIPGLTAISASAAVLYICLQFFRKKKCYIKNIFTVCFCLAFILGAKITDNKNIFFNEMLPEDGRQIIVNGIVENYEIKEKSLAVYLKNCVCIDNEKSDFLKNQKNPGVECKKQNIKNSKVKVRCIVYINKNDSVKIGNQVTVIGEVRRFSSPSNKGQFDEKAYYYGRDIHFSVLGGKMLNKSSGCNWFLQLMRNTREKLHSNIGKITDKMTAGIFQAMLLGEKNSVDEGTKNLFMEGAIGHVLVVSGLHFSIAGMAVFNLLKRLWGSFAAGITSVILLFLFGIMSGFSTSAIRAFVMFTVFMAAKIKGREYDLTTALAMAVLYILWRNPYTLFLQGFILSASAVLGIVIVVPVIDRMFQTKAKILKALFTSLGIQIFTLPVSLYYYFNFNPYSMILNGVVLPLAPVILIWGVISSIISLFFADAARFLMLFPKYILKAIIFICYAMKNLPFFNVYPGKPAFIVCVIYYILLFLLVYFFNRKEKVKRKCSVVFLLLLLVFFIQKKVSLSVTMLDTGQGQCIFIQTEEGAKIMYDGGSTDIKNVAKYRIIPFLKAEGSLELDGVFISHLDEDHISGIREMLIGDEIKIKNLFLPDTSLVDDSYREIRQLAESKGVKVLLFGCGSRIKTGNLTFEGLHPSEDFITSDRNDTSIIVKMSYNKKFSMLFCGDMEKGAEARLLSNIEIPDIDVLQVAHHGSEYTTSEEFLQKVKPEVSLISCGKNNRYGHPHPKLLERLDNIDSKTFVTMECGAVNIKFTKNNYIVTDFLEKNQ